MKNKIGAIEDDFILIGALALGGYFLFNYFTQGTDPAITNELNLTPESNPFNYQFAPFVSFYNNNAPLVTTGQAANPFMWPFNQAPASPQVGTVSIDLFFQSLKTNPPTVSPWGFLNTVDLCQRAENLYNALSVSSFNPLSTSDQTGGVSALSGLTNQLQVAFIACYLWYNYNVDLLSFLQGSIFKSGLTSANLVQIINYVNNLPVNPS